MMRSVSVFLIGVLLLGVTVWFFVRLNAGYIHTTPDGMLELSGEVWWEINESVYLTTVKGGQTVIGKTFVGAVHNGVDWSKARTIDQGDAWEILLEGLEGAIVIDKKSYELRDSPGGF